MKLILASSSPRRKDLLATLRKPFEIVLPKHEEIRKQDEPILDYVQRNSRSKAADVWQNVGSDSLVIAADTVVVRNGSLLEKPTSVTQAEEMLTFLSAGEHSVYTAFSIFSKDKSLTKLVETKVSFRRLSSEEIKSYVASGEPMDKAGAYAAQGFGASFVKSLVGSYTNVVGLPMAELIEELENLGFHCH